jgi:PBSX family phage terminase large subunit
MLRLKKQWFNPVYFHLLKYVSYPDIRRIMVFGGKSGAKTLSLSQLFSVKGHTENASSICYRKEQTTIKTTLKPAFEKAIQNCYLSNAYTIMDFEIRGIRKNHVIFKGLDTEGKVKGIEGFKYLLFDELDHFEEEEWNQANLSLRGIPGQKLFATWNPVRDDIWIKKWIDKNNWTDLPKMIDGNIHSRLDSNSFVRISEDGKTLLIKTTYLDNKWIVGAYDYGYRDENLIYEYERLKDFDENSYNVNVLGVWGKLKTGAEFYHAFSKAKHVKKLTFSPDLPVHLTFDFNVLPYMTMLCCQIDTTGGKTIFKFFKEYCLKNPDNSSSAAARYFVRDFAQYNPAVFYYGDSSGKNRIAGQGNKRNFDDIEAVLLPFLNAASDKVLSRNPGVFSARDFENLILSGFYNGIEIQIDESCTELIADMENVKVSIDGKDKSMVTDKQLNIKYQKYGHTSDAKTYLIVSVLWELYQSRSAYG